MEHVDPQARNRISSVHTFAVSVHALLSICTLALSFFNQMNVFAARVLMRFVIDVPTSSLRDALATGHRAWGKRGPIRDRTPETYPLRIASSSLGVNLRCHLLRIVITVVTHSLVAHFTFAQSFIASVMIRILEHPTRRESDREYVNRTAPLLTSIVFVARCRISRCMHSIQSTGRSCIVDPTIARLRNTRRR